MNETIDGGGERVRSLDFWICPPPHASPRYIEIAIQNPCNTSSVEIYQHWQQSMHGYSE
tara:strand:- start:67 stop:243 length:177 start_codon:yes stop_codon:yes gene_type:complete